MKKANEFALKNAATVLMLFLFAPLGNVYAQGPTQPTLPQKTVSLTLPTQGTSTCPTLTTGSNCIRAVPSGKAVNFQNAINASTCGDTIVLAAGSTYSGNFTIPATSCSGWIEIVSSALTNLPPSGNRVGPSNAANMATISTPNASPAIQFLPDSNHWRLMGLEITTSYVSTSYTVYQLVSAGLSGDNSTNISVQSQLPAYLIIDRVYIHGLSTSNSQRGILMNTQSIGIVDSYCDEIHNNGQDSQCFASWNGSGPFLIQNNFIEASTENIMFGGADPAIANLVPSDITITGNLIQKNTSWRGQVAPYNWQVKNLVEFKNAQRVLLDGNVLQYVWSAAQAGFAVLLTPRNQNGGCPWCVVQDVTITHNLIQHAAMGTEISHEDDIHPPSLPSARVLVQNNLYNDISARWGGGWAFEITSATGLLAAHDITIDHNTAFPDTAVLTLGDSGQAANVALINNICDSGTYGIKGNNAASGTAALNLYISPYFYSDNVFISSSGTGAGYPSGTFWNTQAEVKFTDFSLANYQLVSTSPYHNAGTDGKDIGAWDWTCLNHDSAAALAGKFVPGCTLNENALSEKSLIQPPINLTATIQ
jgi:hypothetical protein